MSVALIIILSTLAYAGVGLAIGRRIYNIKLLKEYLKELKDITSSDWNIRYYMEKHDVELVEEAALKQAKILGMPLADSVMCGCFWPFVGLWHWMYLDGKKFFRNTNIRIFPKNSVEKLIESQRQEALRKAEWDKALKILEEAGMDTKEIRKLGRA